MDVFADPRCPFAHLGLLRFVARRDELGLDVGVRVRAWPLELINDTPLDPNLIGEEIAAAQAEVAPDLFASFDPRTFPATSLPAMALTNAAYDVGLEVGERVALAVRCALFEEGRDISTPEVLLDIANAAGIELPRGDHQACIRRDWAEGRRRGVIGSPHFFIGETGFFCPGLDISRKSGRFEISTSPTRFDDFVARAAA